MSSKSGPVPVDPSAAFDDEATRPVPLQLIARLAAQDPTVQLKIGLLETNEEPEPAQPDPAVKKD